MAVDRKLLFSQADRPSSEDFVEVHRAELLFAVLVVANLLTFLKLCKRLGKKGNFGKTVCFQAALYPVRHY